MLNLTTPSILSNFNFPSFPQCDYSLPTLKEIPTAMIGDGLIGLACSMIYKVPPEFMIAVFAIRGLATTLFYQIASLFLKNSDLQSQKIYAYTFIVVNMTFIFTLRALNLIGSLSSCLFGAAAIGVLIHRVRYIQTQENPSIV